MPWESERMSDITVRTLGEDDWDTYRKVRLAALEDAPQAFVAKAEEERGLDEDYWRSRMRRSQRLVAERDDEQVAVASLGQLGADQPGVAELFGLWVHPDLRGKGVASMVVQAAAEAARKRGSSHLAYWVGTENGRAVAFASGYGFRPTDSRRPMRVQSEEDGEEEIAMVLPLAGDRGGLPDL